MKLSQNEVEEALEVINQTVKKTRSAMAKSGTYIFLINTGVIWLVGFLANQFLTGEIVKYVWIGITFVGSIGAVLFSSRMGQRVRGTLTKTYVKRIVIFWLLLILFGIGVIAVVQPIDSKQITTLIILLVMLGQVAMGLLFSFSSTWWAIPAALLALVGYFFLPDYFYLWIAVLVGGGMVVLGVYIRLRW